MSLHFLLGRRNKKSQTDKRRLAALHFEIPHAEGLELVRPTINPRATWDTYTMYSSLLPSGVIVKSMPTKGDF